MSGEGSGFGVRGSGAPVWLERRTIGPCELYLGDCLDVLAAGLIPSGSTVVTDPPYGIGYRHSANRQDNWAKLNNVHSRSGLASEIVGDSENFDPTPWLAFAAASRRAASDKTLKSGARIALCGADHYAARLPPFGAFYCWDKSCGGGPADSFADAEFIWMSTRNARRVFRHQWKGRLRLGDSAPRMHVAQKPVPLMAWIIETVRTPVGSIVLDPYMGSGTTGVACIQTGRRFIGIEIDPDHFETACARIAAAITEPRTPNPEPCEAEPRTPNPEPGAAP